MHDAAPAFQYATLPQQHEAAQLGMWTFLSTEVLFFGSLLLGYFVYRHGYPQDFAAAGRHTKIVLGVLNTAILLTSSLTMTVVVQAVASGENFRRLILACLTVTAVLGIAFLAVKGFEYKDDIEKHLVPGAQFALTEKSAQLFFGLYWTLTGVHAIHLTIGILMVLRLALLAFRRRLELDRNPEIRVTGLYWHLVDVIWIFLYALIYLPGRAS